MLELIILVVRAVQFLFAVIVLALTGHVASASENHAPSQNNFLIFVSVWTLLILLYLSLAPKFMSSIAHPMIIAGLDGLTMLFWFAGFIALAVFRARLADIDLVDLDADLFLGRACDNLGNICPCMEAAVVFAAFEWALFAFTTVFGAIEGFRGRKRGTTTAPATA